MPNIRAAIRAYGSGEMDGSKDVWFADGKMVSKETAFEFVKNKKGFVANEVSMYLWKRTPELFGSTEKQNRADCASRWLTKSLMNRVSWG